MKDPAEIIKTGERKISSGDGDVCEAEVFFGSQVIGLLLILKFKIRIKSITN